MNLNSEIARSYSLKAHLSRRCHLMQGKVQFISTSGLPWGCTLN
jgi:hypothetical protein